MHEVLIHPYHKDLTAIEFGCKNTIPENFLIFIGGLGDGFLTVPYVTTLAEAISQKFGSLWVLVQALISSSYKGYGTGSLQRDAKELGKLVEYLKTKRGNKTSKVILMGHSTGCQDTMEYLTKYAQSPDFIDIQKLDGGILQAPVSDSEAILRHEKASDFLDLAKSLIEEGKSNELLPHGALEILFGSPCSAYRFNSLVSKYGDDDYFSSYLTDLDYQRSFGAVLVPLLVLYSGSDEFVPSTVDKVALINRWQNKTQPRVWSVHSGVIDGATHNIGARSKSGAVEDVVSRVLAFIKEI